MENKFLYAATLVDFAGVKVPFRIDGHAVDPVELTGHAAAPSKGAHNRQIVPRKYPELLISPIRIVEKHLSGVRRKLDVPGRAVPERPLRKKHLFHKGPVLLKHLDAVVYPVGNVDESAR